jgi:predicted ATPase
MTFAIEVLLDRFGLDDFNTPYEIFAQRLRYEVTLGIARSRDGATRGVFVTHEHCRPLSKGEDRSRTARNKKLSYNARVNPFIRVNDSGDAILVRQDGRQKHGRPVQFALKEASRTALSTVQTAEFPHLYALREILARLRFLEINPRAARNANDLFEERELRSDASNLSAVLARLKEETATENRPEGVLADIVADLASLIPSVSALNVDSSQALRQHSFDLGFIHDQRFSSRVISDGTIRLLALLTLLNDPDRRGTLCFEEPENGVHEGRLPALISLLRSSTSPDYEPVFQVLLNTHSPKVMEALQDDEIIAADTVTTVDPQTRLQSTKTRMRAGLSGSADMFDPQKHLSRSEIERLLQHSTDAA